VSADGEAVFLAETWTNRIHRYELRPDGTVGPRVLFATLPDEPGPDGMAFDAEGRLFVAHHGAGRVDVLSPDGQVIDAIGVPGKGVTNVAFGGDDLRCLVITEVETAAIYQVRLPVAGQRLYGGPRHG
jgi:sugar lactone lactonase YvrE